MKKSKFHRHLIFVLFLIVSINFSFAYSAVFYISPTGNDNWSGKIENPNADKTDGPLKSLAGARDAVRKLKSKGKLTEPITVYIMNGTYYLTEPVVFTPKDSGTKECPIVYQAYKDARPVFNAGKEIKGFQKVKDGLWKTKVNRKFEQLYINGKRAVRAKEPDEGYFYIEKINEKILGDARSRRAEAEHTIEVKPEVLAPLKGLDKDDVTSVAFLVYHKWDTTKRYIEKVDFDNNTFTIKGTKLRHWNPVSAQNHFFIENYKAALDSPGEWFLDRDGFLHYKPRVDEKISKTTAIAPFTEKFLVFDGDPENVNHVEHITIKGLSFQYSGYTMPRSGVEPAQAANDTGATIMITGGRHINFEDCQIAHTGLYAIEFKHGCRDCSVEGCELFDLGGGGVKMGGSSNPDSSRFTKKITVHNNIIQQGGRLFPAAVGVWSGHSSDNRITHNRINDLYYTGVSVGWRWGFGRSPSKRNTIAYNHIYDIGQGVLSDMGGVYTLGKSEGTVVHNNVVHDVSAYAYGGWGLYTDEGSTGIVLTNNLVYRTTHGGFDQHYGKENVIKNNIFAFGRDFQVRRNDKEKQHSSFIFTNNIVYFDQGKVLGGDWGISNDSWYKLNNNLYYNAKGDTYNFDGKTFKQWQATGQDANSIIADPKFEAPYNDNFKLSEDSPASKIGFVPFDYCLAGPMK